MDVMEQRLVVLEALVHNLRVEQATLQANVTSLERSSQHLHDSVDKLTGAMNRFSGAMWAVSGVGVVIGALIGFAISLWST